MKALNNLPTNYREIFSVNLQNDKKIAVVLNVVSLLIGAVMAVPMHFYIPITTLFDFSQGFLVYFIRFAVLLLSMIVYLILHEAVLYGNEYCYDDEKERQHELHTDEYVTQSLTFGC